MADDKETPPTLDEVLNSKFDEIQARENVTEEPINVGPSEPDVKPPAKAERQRAEDGKFAKKADKADKKAEKNELEADAGAEIATHAEDIKADKGTEGKAEAVSQPPASWSATAKALWGDLPPEVRAEAHRLERDAQRLVARNATEKRQYEGLEQILGPRRQRLAAMYGSEARALEQLFALSDFAEKDPQGFLKYFAQQRGLNLASMNQGFQPLDPNTAALHQQIQALNGKIQQSETQQQAAERQQVERLYQAFANDPKNIYFNDVREDMADLLDSGAARDFEDAYNKAIWANPATRERLFSERAKAESEKRQKEAEQAAKEAKRVQATNVATKGVRGSSPDKPNSIDETLNRTWDALHGAA
jgi:hypothetical protein